ncbi:replication initiator protein [robinz microvirus RP_42]|nr:replication initiator protein [robinz microvirus RP_42]
MNCFSPKLVPDPRYKGEGITMFVPCRKCVPCIKRYVNEWTARLVDETLYSTGLSLFITLTYEVEPPEYSKLHTHSYLKSIRNEYPTNRFKYFLVGERGTLSSRRHYHLILYSDIDISRSETYLQFLQGAWSHGFSKIAPVSPKTCAYVAKYITPINDGDKFLFMSRGLGCKRVSPEMVESYSSRPRHYYVSNGYKKPLPRFYKRKLAEHAIVFPTYNEKLLRKQLSQLEDYRIDWDSYDTNQLLAHRDSYRLQQQQIATETFVRSLSEKQSQI